MLEGAGWRQGPICSKYWKLVIRCQGSLDKVARGGTNSPWPSRPGPSLGPPLALNLALLQALMACCALPLCRVRTLGPWMLEQGEGDTLCPHPNLVDDPDFPRAQGAQDWAESPALVGGRGVPVPIPPNDDPPSAWRSQGTPYLKKETSSS